MSPLDFQQGPLQYQPQLTVWDLMIGCVCVDGVNGRDEGRIGHRNTGNELLCLCIDGQKLELRVGDSKPQNGDQDREDDGPHRINPPAQLAAANREDTKST